MSQDEEQQRPEVTASGVHESAAQVLRLDNFAGSARGLTAVARARLIARAVLEVQDLARQVSSRSTENELSAKLRELHTTLNDASERSRTELKDHLEAVSRAALHFHDNALRGEREAANQYVKVSAAFKLDHEAILRLAGKPLRIEGSTKDFNVSAGADQAFKALNVLKSAAIVLCTSLLASFLSLLTDIDKFQSASELASAAIHAYTPVVTASAVGLTALMSAILMFVQRRQKPADALARLQHVIRTQFSNAITSANIRVVRDTD